MISVELSGLELFGHHGVTEEERARSQRFLFDVRMVVPADALSDRIEDAVDYRDVARTVREVSDGRQFRLLEALADAVASAIVDRFPVEAVSVEVRKPDVELDPPVQFSAATATRSRS